MEELQRPMEGSTDFMSTQPHGLHVPSTRESTAQATWRHQWQQVPEQWRSGEYRLDAEPYTHVFSRNANYLRSDKTYFFVPLAYERARQECAWWVWTVYDDGSRKIEPSMLAWWGRALASLADDRHALTGQAVADMSVADFAPNVVLDRAIAAFRAKNGRAPSVGNLRNLESVTRSINTYVTVRCVDREWWQNDVWNMRLDERIPRRPHEPHGDRVVNIGAVKPEWLREGLRYYLAQMLIHDGLTWTTIFGRLTSIGTYFGSFCQSREVTRPVLAESLPELRAVMNDYLSWLRSPEATARGDRLSPQTVSAAQSHLQTFYSWMADDPETAAHQTGLAEWGELNVSHTRLWPPNMGGRRKGNKKEIRYFSDYEAAKLHAYLPILSTPTSDTVTIEFDGQQRTFNGLGDPQAARVWKLQTLTGRRASEILMMDRNPVTLLDLGEQGNEPAPEDFIARLRYQQTKVDGVDPVILVQRMAVDIIREQQRWLDVNFPEADSSYLFMQPRGNHRGKRARPYRSYHDALARLNQITELTDDRGESLTYTQTHRWRHTVATNMLNAGVPVHVVMQHLGHKSPEMTMNYAATLESTARKEFEKYKHVGAHGRALDINPSDMYDLAQIDRRANRILPNGTCLLPPSRGCDKGNACLSCGHFATDATYLDEHVEQRAKVAAHIEVIQRQFKERRGMDMPDDHVLLQGRRAELSSLDAIIAKLEQQGERAAVKGAGIVSLTTDPDERDALRQGLAARLDGPREEPRA